MFNVLKKIVSIEGENNISYASQGLARTLASGIVP